MQLVIATTVYDPLAPVFWRAYLDAGGISPQAVFFIAPRRRPALLRQAGEAILLFGMADAVRSWQAGRESRRTLLSDPHRFFPGAAVFHARSLNRGDGFVALQRTAPTLLVSVGAPEIFTRSLLDLPTVGSVNVHNGRLPAFRGLFGTFWEMRHGEPWGYASLHAMVPKVDTGPVLAETAVPITGERLLHVLSAKKREGGRLLAWLVRFVEREGELPPAKPGGDPRSNYYGWPTWRDLLAYRVVTRRSRTQSRGGPAHAWPPGVSGDET